MIAPEPAHLHLARGSDDRYRTGMATAPRSFDQRALELAQDAVYIGVGFGVLAVQRAQVQRRALHAALDRRLGRLAALVGRSDGH